MATVTKTAAPAPSLDELKSSLQGLKARADALASRKDGLTKEATIQEQNKDRALSELAELGYPQAQGMNITDLTALGVDLLTKLQDTLTELDRVVVVAEQAVNGISAVGGSLDMD